MPGLRPQEVVDALGGPLGRGELSLFTGAGLSLGATDRDGQPIPSSSDLRAEIHQLLYPGEDPSADDSSLAELYAVAIDRERAALTALLERRLTIDPGSLTKEQVLWMQMPWVRAYTLNVDDFEEAVAVQASLPRAVRAFSALRDTSATPDGDFLPFVHLNGVLGDVPDVTFSEPQYGQRLAGLEPLYQQVVLDLTAAPVVFVGTRLMEPSLWRHIALRDGARTTGYAGYPRSYLVAPSLPPARRELLGQYNIEWIEATADQFARGALAPLSRQAASGHARLRAKLRRHERHTSVASVADLLREQEEEDFASEYLLGAHPRWGDLRTGRIIERHFEQHIDTRLRSAALLVHGTAGAGTSSTLMRIAARIAAQGDEALWIDAREVGDAPHLIRTLKVRSGNFAVIIDNADALSHNGRRLLDELRSTGRRILVVLGIRSYLRGRRSVPVAGQFPRGYLTSVRVPHLESSDIDNLIDALERDGKLGRLTAMTPQRRVHQFETNANRQLLVAMIQVTSGSDHVRKALDEYQQLEDTAKQLYAVASVATVLGLPLTKRELLSGIGRVSAPELAGLQTLLDAQLLLPTGDRFEVRHRVVAEVVVKGLERQGQLFAPYLQLSEALAVEYEIDRPHARTTKLLASLLNYERLRGYFTTTEIRRYYGRLQDLLGPDYHFWLQRGAYEVKHGRLQLAENYLERARALGGHDFRVEVEYAYFLLRRAREDPLGPEAESAVREGESVLRHWIDRVGANNPYPYHVLLTQKVRWLEVAPRTKEQRTDELQRLFALAEEGVRRHPGYRLLILARKDVQKALLMQAVDEKATQTRGSAGSATGPRGSRPGARRRRS